MKLYRIAQVQANISPELLSEIMFDLEGFSEPIEFAIEHGLIDENDPDDVVSYTKAKTLYDKLNANNFSFTPQETKEFWEIVSNVETKDEVWKNPKLRTEIKLLGIQLGVYKPITDKELESVQFSSGKPYAFIYKGVKYI